MCSKIGGVIWLKHVLYVVISQIEFEGVYGFQHLIVDNIRITPNLCSKFHDALVFSIFFKFSRVSLMAIHIDFDGVWLGLPFLYYALVA